MGTFFCRKTGFFRAKTGEKAGFSRFVLLISSQL